MSQVSIDHPEQYDIMKHGAITHETHMDLKVFRAKLNIEDNLRIYYPNIAVAMSWGKDSITIAQLAREVMPPDVPLKFYFTDTGNKFDETYEYMEVAKEYFAPVEVLTFKPKKPLNNCDTCRAWKVVAAREGPLDFGLKALIVGVRWDECEAREETPWGMMVNGVWRLHPILAWTEENIWDFLKDRKVPYNPLYDQGYRSLGCKPPCTEKTPFGMGERGGRQQDKETQMVKLRGEGYW